MPFTLSHPAAVVPLLRWTRHPVFVLALLVGCLAPDFGYYLRSYPLGNFSHSLIGSLVVCLPVGLVVMACLLIAREPILFLMPSRLRAILGRALVLPAKGRWPVLVEMSFWLWIGTLTHIAWDAFTHRTGWVVERVALLQTPVRLFDYHTLPVYNILQHVSTVFGLVVVAILACRLYCRTTCVPHAPRADLPRFAFWVVLVLLSLGLAFPFANEFVSRYEGAFKLMVLAFQMATMSGLIFAILIAVSLVVVFCYLALLDRRLAEAQAQPTARE